ncbi:MAG: hypothetical protein COZ75_02195 [Flavobacteriaceae bacterium CG_4_8_14_3_um_filter_34_10]|nr:SdpI family protein [Flavobacteriia bacterium]OIP49389.1 MAG: hypothetical protein AUK33_10505 [Flavobacteriaceae bacterium CG2_30_34_30]PIX10318.1 MAG: hypothetical protein COZ75_02195 [Flavobacteriaceae bacterium CG_4_8_14_3_um_filter_34_10]
MVFSNSLFLILGLTGLVFITGGYLFFKFPPKKINHLYGYRTKTSMNSQEKWDFSQRYSSKEMIKLGIYMVLIGIIGSIINPSENISIPLAIGVLIFCCVMLFIKTERELKNNFKTNS